MKSKSRNLRKKALTITTLLGCGLASASAHATNHHRTSQQAGSTDSSPSIIDAGALAGVGLLSNGFGNQILLGLEGGYRLLPQLRVGGYFTYNSLPNLPGLSGSLFTICPQADYVFTGALAGFRAGGRLGLAFTHFSSGISQGGISVPVEGASSTSFVLGPEISYDYALGGGLSVGGEANIMFYTSNTGFNSVNFLAALRYWF